MRTALMALPAILCLAGAGTADAAASQVARGAYIVNGVAGPIAVDAAGVSRS